RRLQKAFDPRRSGEPVLLRLWVAAYPAVASRALASLSGRRLRSKAAQPAPNLKSKLSSRVDYSIALNCSSLRIATPRFRAFSSFEPASAPATTNAVFLLTEELTFPPRAS